MNNIDDKIDKKLTRLLSDEYFIENLNFRNNIKHCILIKITI